MKRKHSSVLSSVIILSKPDNEIDLMTLKNILQFFFYLIIYIFLNANISKIQVAFLFATHEEICAYKYKRNDCIIIKALPILKVWF